MAVRASVQRMTARCQGLVTGNRRFPLTGIPLANTAAREYCLCQHEIQKISTCTDVHPSTQISEFITDLSRSKMCSSILGARVPLHRTFCTGNELQGSRQTSSGNLDSLFGPDLLELEGDRRPRDAGKTKNYNSR